MSETVIRPAGFHLVDDTSPDIRYSSSWSLTTVSSRNYSSVGLPLFPIYGTVHTYNTTELEPANFSFVFDGWFLQVEFIQSSSNDNVTCQIDGKPQSLTPTGCSSVKLTNGRHELFMSFKTTNTFNPYIFDYIRYIPSYNITSPSGDLWINAWDPTVNSTAQSDSPNILTPGETLDTVFTGTSLGVYTTSINTDSHEPTKGFYTMDDNNPVNFTIENISTNLATFVSPQLIIQTPQLAEGPHSFHLELYRQADGSPASVPLRGTILLQNTSRELEVFPNPSILLAPTTSNSPSSVPIPGSSMAAKKSPNRLGPIIGGTLSGVALIVLVVLVILVRRRQQNTSGSANKTSALINPFVPRRLVAAPSKFGRLDEEKASSRTYPSSPTPQTDTYRPLPRVRVHEDSGENVDQPSDVAIAIDIPPLYEGIPGVHLVQLHDQNTPGGLEAGRPVMDKSRCCCCGSGEAHPTNTTGG